MTYTKLAALALAVLPLAAATSGCTAGGPAPSAPHTYELGTIGGFGELVNSGCAAGHAVVSKLADFHPSGSVPIVAVQSALLLNERSVVNWNRILEDRSLTEAEREPVVGPHFRSQAAGGLDVVGRR